MIEALTFFAWRFAVCCAATWLVWRLGFGVGTLFMIGLFGILLAKPLIDIASALRHALRREVWRDVQGRHYAFKGRPVRVITDADQRRWIRLADVRRITGFTASDAALQVTYPQGWRKLGTPAEPYLCDETLLTHLAKERSPENARMRLWVEREIVFPARRQRERFGIKLEALDFRSSSDSPAA